MCRKLVNRRDRFSSQGKPGPQTQGTGFTLIEALIALSITSLAGAVLLLSVQSSLGTTIESVERTIADGVAEQTLDEILTKRYVGQGDPPLLVTLGALTNELLGLGTSLFDDTDDYNGYIAQPLKGLFGEVLGTGDDNGNLRLANFRVRSDFLRAIRNAWKGDICFSQLVTGWCTGMNLSKRTMHSHRRAQSEGNSETPTSWLSHCKGRGVH